MSFRKNKTDTKNEQSGPTRDTKVDSDTQAPTQKQKDDSMIQQNTRVDGRNANADVDVEERADKPMAPKKPEEPPEIAAWFKDKLVIDFMVQDVLSDLKEVLANSSISELENKIETEMNSLVKITRETKVLTEIKDIMDELNTISYNFQQQAKIVNAMVEDCATVRHHAEMERAKKSEDKYQQWKAEKTRRTLVTEMKLSALKNSLPRGLRTANRRGSHPSGQKEKKENRLWA